MKKRFFALFLLFSLFIAGCQTGQEANADFNTFCMETFRSYAASDSLTLNYTLMSPKKYGITDLPDGFSSFSLHDLKQTQTSTENTLARLRSFASKNLSREDRLLYDTLVTGGHPHACSFVFVRPFEWDSGTASGSSL